MKFRQTCEQVADRLGIGVSFFSPQPSRPPFHDDGNLHVTSRGTRACFHLDQDAPDKLQNQRTRLILIALDMERHIGPQTPLDETNDQDS